MIRKAMLPCLASCVLAIGCNLPGGACTDIGCENGLVVAIQGSPPGPWRVEVSAGPETRALECPAGSPCQFVQFQGFTPSTATVTVTMGDRTATSQVTITPREVRPNGPSCLPVCNQPLVTVAPPLP
jgi:hypothetical protein